MGIKWKGQTGTFRDILFFILTRWGYTDTCIWKNALRCTIMILCFIANCASVNCCEHLKNCYGRKIQPF